MELSIKQIKSLIQFCIKNKVKHIKYKEFEADLEIQLEPFEIKPLEPSSKSLEEDLYYSAQ